MVNNVFNTVETKQQILDNSTDHVSLSQENVAQLMQLLQKINQKSAGTGDASANITCAEPFTEKKVLWCLVNSKEVYMSSSQVNQQFLKRVSNSNPENQPVDFTKSIKF